MNTKTMTDEEWLAPKRINNRLLWLLMMVLATLMIVFFNIITIQNLQKEVSDLRKQQNNETVLGVSEHIDWTEPVIVEKPKSSLDIIDERITTLENKVYSGDAMSSDETLDNLASDLMMLHEALEEYKEWRKAND